MLYWAAGIAAVLFVGWFLRRRAVMRATRGLDHLVELASGLKRLQAEVAEGVGSSQEALERGQPPPSLETTRGAMFAWTAHRAEGGYEHRFSLFSGWETWWVNGFLLAFVCDRLGLPWSEASLTRTTRGLSQLSVVLPETAHAAALSRSIELPTSSDFSDVVGRVNGLMARVPPPPFADLQQE